MGHRLCYTGTRTNKGVLVRMVRMDVLAPKGIFEDEEIFVVTPVAGLDDYVLDDYAFDEYDDDQAA